MSHFLSTVRNYGITALFGIEWTQNQLQKRQYNPWNCQNFDILRMKLSLQCSLVHNLSSTSLYFNANPIAAWLSIVELHNEKLEKVFEPENIDQLGILCQLYVLYCIYGSNRPNYLLQFNGDFAYSPSIYIRDDAPTPFTLLSLAYPIELEDD